MRIRLLHGRKYKFRCSKCGCKREGTVYRDLYEWRARMECGHHKHLGYTKPLDVLEAEGLINQ